MQSTLLIVDELVDFDLLVSPTNNDVHIIAVTHENVRKIVIVSIWNIKVLDPRCSFSISHSSLEIDFFINFELSIL